MPVEFIENKNIVNIDIQLLMEDIIDKVYDNIIEYYKKNKINDIILIDKRLDLIRNRLIYMKFLTNKNQLKENHVVLAITKNIENTENGIVDRVEDNFIILKKRQKARLFKINMDDYYVFFKEKKTPQQEKNDHLKSLLNCILNNKIKIKKIRK